MHSNTLAALKQGQKVTIEAVDAADPQVQRLMTLGLVEGAEVEFASSALGGDPLEIDVMGYALSLRKAEATQIDVELVS